METLITYKSNYGSSKQYAKWLGEALHCEVKDLKEVSKNEIENYKIIIHGGGLYAGKLSGLSFYKKNMKVIKNKGIHFIAFATGASLQGNRVITEIRKTNFNDELMKDTPFFYCEGNYDYNKMNFIHKAMMAMMHKMLSKKIDKAKRPRQEDVEFLSLIYKHFERCNIKWIKQITDYISTISFNN